MERANKTAMAIALITYENDKRRRALFEGAENATAIDAVAMTALTGAGIATTLLAFVLGGDMEPEEARDEFTKAIDAMLFGAEIHDIERGNE